MKDFYGVELKVGDIIIYRSSSEGGGKMELREIIEINDNGRCANLRNVKTGTIGRRAYVNEGTAILHKRPGDEGEHKTPRGI